MQTSCKNMMPVDYDFFCNLSIKPHGSPHPQDWTFMVHVSVFLLLYSSNLEYMFCLQSYYTKDEDERRPTEV